MARPGVGEEGRDAGVVQHVELGRCRRERLRAARLERVDAGAADEAAAAGDEDPHALASIRYQGNEVHPGLSPSLTGTPSSRAVT
jgi:hypothetical protein